MSFLNQNRISHASLYSGHKRSKYVRSNTHVYTVWIIKKSSYKPRQERNEFKTSGTTRVVLLVLVILCDYKSERIIINTASFRFVSSLTRVNDVRVYLFE